MLVDERGDAGHDFGSGSNPQLASFAIGDFTGDPAPAFVFVFIFIFIFAAAPFATFPRSPLLLRAATCALPPSGDPGMCRSPACRSVAPVVWRARRPPRAEPELEP